MTSKAPSTDIDKTKTNADDKEKEIKLEEPRWAAKWYKAFKKQEEDFVTKFSDLSKEWVLKKLQETTPEHFKDIKSYDEAMEILKEGKWVERIGTYLDMHDWLDLNVKKHEESNKKEIEIENLKDGLKKEDEKKEKPAEKKNELNEKKDKEKNNENSYDKSEKKYNKEEKPEKKESNKKNNESDDLEDDKSDKKTKEKTPEKKWFFRTIGKAIWAIPRQTGNLIRYPFRAGRNWVKMTGRSLKYFWFEILNFPSGGAAMKKIRDKYVADMKGYGKKFKWNYKKWGK